MFRAVVRLSLHRIIEHRLQFLIEFLSSKWKQLLRDVAQTVHDNCRQIVSRA
jgi:hypothetical protein